MTFAGSAGRPTTDPWLDRAPHARVWRWRIVPSAPIGVERTVDAAHAVLAALNQTARDLFGDSRLPPDLHAAPGSLATDGRETHHHAFIFPEDLDLDGALDHLCVALSGRPEVEGFTRRSLTLLAACPGFWLGGVDARLEAVGLGPVCPFGLDAPARVWRSLTPFVPPLRRHAAAAQVEISLRRQGFPPVRAEPISSAIAPPGRIVPARAFAPSGPAARRWTAAFAAQAAEMAFWSLEFDDAVEGPLAIGALCHFGLGRFAPETW
jgi:CRISPR-associated protein Csb2